MIPRETKEYKRSKRGRETKKRRAKEINLREQHRAACRQEVNHQPTRQDHGVHQNGVADGLGVPGVSHCFLKSSNTNPDTGTGDEILGPAMWYESTEWWPQKKGEREIQSTTHHIRHCPSHPETQQESRTRGHSEKVQSQTNPQMSLLGEDASQGQHEEGDKHQKDGRHSKQELVH